MRVFIAILSMCFLVGCVTRKKIHTTDTKTADSVTSAAVKSDSNNIFQSHTSIEKDTTIGYSGKKVLDTLTPDEQEIPKNRNGKKRPVHKEKKVNGLTVWADIDTNGVLYIGASSDSLTFTIKGLIRKNDSLSRVNSQLEYRAKASTHRESQEESLYERINRKGVLLWLLQNLYWIAIIIAAVYLLLSLLKKSFNPLAWFKAK